MIWQKDARFSQSCSQSVREVTIINSISYGFSQWGALVKWKKILLITKRLWNWKILIVSLQTTIYLFFRLRFFWDCWNSNLSPETLSESMNSYHICDIQIFQKVHFSSGNNNSNLSIMLKKFGYQEKYWSNWMKLPS